MGLFNKLGRQVEEFKQTVEAEAEAEADYQCRACDERFHAEHQECPECGSSDVVATNPEE